MKKILKTLILSVSTLFMIVDNFSCKTKPHEITLQGNKLHGIGRVMPDDTLGLELISSAAHTSFSFEGATCLVRTASGSANTHSYVQYELDGQYMGRFVVNGSGDSLLIEAKSEGAHTVTLYKATEAHSGPLFIQTIKGINLVALKPENPLTIEIIGNSITCGAAADTSQVKCGQGEYHDQHNAYMAYGPRMARALGMEYMLSSVSGIGIYRTWNMESPDMPMVYESLDFRENGQRRYDFDSFSPDIVCIALGTNDFSNGDGVNKRPPFDQDFFVAEYVRFVKQVKSHYPGVKLVLFNSPMVQGDKNYTFLSCLQQVKDVIEAQYPQDHKIEIFSFQPMAAGGCTGHPNVEDHKLMADQLTPFIRNLIQNN